jgi:hypothetical protein
VLWAVAMAVYFHETHVKTRTTPRTGHRAGALMSGYGPRMKTHPADAPAQGSGAMMTTMTTPESGDLAARPAQASRLIRG